jgi:hypothetical protein
MGAACAAWASVAGVALAPAAKAPPGAREGGAAEVASADPERAKAALWSALVAWERAVGGAHPDERVGADALRKVLAEQGYFQ